MAKHEPILPNVWPPADPGVFLGGDAPTHQADLDALIAEELGEDPDPEDLARHYVRDSEGRFADVPGVGDDAPDRDPADDQEAEAMDGLAAYVGERPMTPGQRTALRAHVAASTTSKPRLFRVNRADPQWTPGEPVTLALTSFTDVDITGGGSSAGAINFKYDDEAIISVESPRSGLDVDYRSLPGAKQFYAGDERETLVDADYQVVRVEDAPDPRWSEGSEKTVPHYVLREIRAGASGDRSDARTPAGSWQDDEYDPYDYAREGEPRADRMEEVRAGDLKKGDVVLLGSRLFTVREVLPRRGGAGNRIRFRVEGRPKTYSYVVTQRIRRVAGPYRDDGAPLGGMGGTPLAVALTAVEALEAYDLAYNPTQPRDSEGKWVKYLAGLPSMADVNRLYDEIPAADPRFPAVKAERQKRVVANRAATDARLSAPGLAPGEALKYKKMAPKEQAQYLRSMSAPALKELEAENHVPAARKRVRAELKSRGLGSKPAANSGNSKPKAEAVAPTPPKPKMKWVEGDGGAKVPEPMAGWADSLSPEARKAVRDYSYHTYYPTNEALRDVKGDLSQLPAVAEGDGPAGPFDLRAHIADLDATIGQAKTPVPLTLYRGGADPQIEDLYRSGTLKGAVIIDHGFASTSLGKETADEFAGIGADNIEFETGTRPMEIVNEIMAPAGTPAAFIAPVSDFPEQDEVVLHRGTSMRAESFSYDPSGDYLYVRWRIV